MLDVGEQARGAVAGQRRPPVRVERFRGCHALHLVGAAAQVAAHLHAEHVQRRREALSERCLLGRDHKRPLPARQCHRLRHDLGSVDQCLHVSGAARRVSVQPIRNVFALRCGDRIAKLRRGDDAHGARLALAPVAVLQGRGDGLRVLHSRLVRVRQDHHVTARRHPLGVEVAPLPGAAFGARCSEAKAVQPVAVFLPFHHHHRRRVRGVVQLLNAVQQPAADAGT